MSIRILINIFILLFFYSSISYADITSNLLSRWKIDERSGSVITDNEGSLGVSLNSGNSPTWTDGKINGALSFNSSSSQYMSTNSTLNIGTNIMTVSFWMDSSYSITDGLAVEMSSNSNSNINVIIIDTKAGSTIGSCTAGKFSASMKGTTGNKQVCVNAQTSGWHLFTIVFDASTSSGVLSLYVDGVLPTQFNGNNNKTGTSNFETFTWYFMSRNGSSLFMNGKIDDIRIYGRALSSSDVLDLYNQGINGNKISNATLRNAVIK